MDGAGSPDGPLVVGLDLGGTKILGTAIDPSHAGADAVAEIRTSTPSGTDDVLDALAATASALRDEVRARTGRDVRAVGLGLPGLVDRAGTFVYGPNLPGVVGVAIGAEVGERLGLPVVVDNDATCAAWGEHERGAARGRNHSLLVTLGTGIGGGLTVKGEILRGAYGFAGEPGHMVVDPTGPECPCGRRGCWERYASGWGLGNLARMAVLDGRTPPDAAHLGAAGGDVDAIRGEHVVAAARDGDPAATAVLDEFADWLGLGLANLVNVLDSEIVVIGGGVSGDADLFIDRTRRRVRSLTLGGVEGRHRVPIVPARLAGRAGAVGAALLAALRT